MELTRLECALSSELRILETVAFNCVMGGFRHRSGSGIFDESWSFLHADHRLGVAGEQDMKCDKNTADRKRSASACEGGGAGNAPRCWHAIITVAIANAMTLASRLRRGAVRR